MLKTFKLFGFLFLLISVFTMVSNAQKVLLKGSDSKVDQPFIFIARDQKTYTQLQNLVEGLPDGLTIDFQKNAVVAAFGGERPTGGWTIEIKRTINTFVIEIKSPGKDMMVGQVITTPFNVSLVPVEVDKALPLDVVSKHFNDKRKYFPVSQADFEFTGGIAGIRKQFKANGMISLLTFGDYVTAWFDLKSHGIKEERRLFEATSGIFKYGKFEFTRLDAGSFVDSPHPPFSVKGTFINDILSLNFEPLPVNVADGYEGKGSLEAAIKN